MELKKIVIISNYYPPEMGAAANRIKNMAEGLASKGNDVTVICPLPNYPLGRIFDEYKGKFKVDEIQKAILIKRYWIWPSNSKNSIARLLSMCSFAWSLWFSLFFFIKKKPDLIIVQSPPLFVALSGLLLSKVLRTKSVLNVSDLWPLSAFELGMIKKGTMYAILEKIERFNYFLSDKIIGQSEETISYINKIVTKKTMVYRNVPHLKNIGPVSSKNDTLKIVYAGLLGYAQGILKVCKEINFKELNVEFHIYGSGMEEKEIIKCIAQNKNNVFFHGSLPASQIKKEILKYDVSLVSLISPIYGAVPSKIFELMQLQIPILFRGDGEGAKIVLNEKNGLVSSSSDFNGLMKNIVIFRDMNQKTFNNFKVACGLAHTKKYNLENELDKLDDFVS